MPCTQATLTRLSWRRTTGPDSRTRGAEPSAPWLIRSALASCPTDAACLYTARKSHIALSEATGANWIDCQGAAWGVALAFERSSLAEFVRWEREHVPDAYPHDDGRVSMWRIKTRKPYAIIAPSLLGKHTTRVLKEIR